MPKLSIIVPVYNVELYIHKCIDSILAQTFTDFELILIDDGSPDKCGEICDEYARNDIRIKVIHKENGGLASARNDGLDIAQGEYIGFVDSDDWIHRDMYNELILSIENNESDISICNVIWTSNSCEKFKEVDFDFIIMDNIDGLKRLILGDLFLETAWDKVYKKELFNGIRYPNGHIHEDTATTYKLFAKANKIVYINKPFYYYLQREGSIANCRINDEKLYQLAAIDDMYTFIEEKYPEVINEMDGLYFRVVFNWFKLIKENPDCDLDNKYKGILRHYVRKRCSNIILNKYLTFVQKSLLYALVLSFRLFMVFS